MIGIRKTPTGWQAYVRVKGRLYAKRYPPTASLTEMKRWRNSKRVRVEEAIPETDGTPFGPDVDYYLKQVQSMPSYRDRKDDLDRWVALFGRDKIRQTITASDIRIHLERWRADGYAASTVNHRRTALMHLWTVLDGKSAPNPARDVPKYREDIAPPAALSLPAITALFAAMGHSQNRARLMLMAWTGWPQKQIMRLEPDDIRWNDAVFIRGRQKGRGVEGVWLPLLPPAWTALREFKRQGCWGTFSTSSMRKAFRRAADAVAANRRLPKAIRQEVADITPYQLRHSFGSLVAGITQDDRAVQSLMLHKDIRQTHRYTRGTTDPRTFAAVSKVASELKTVATSRNR